MASQDHVVVYTCSSYMLWYVPVLHICCGHVEMKRFQILKVLAKRSYNTQLEYYFALDDLR